MFLTKPRSTEACEGDRVIIRCEVIGDPKPDVIWLRDFLKVTLINRSIDGRKLEVNFDQRVSDWIQMFVWVLKKHIRNQSDVIIIALEP